MRVRKSSCVKVFTSFEMQILYPLMGNMFSMPRYLTIEISQNYILQVNFIEYISLYISCASIYYAINVPPQLVFFLLLGFFLLLRLPQQSDQPSHAPGVRIFRLILNQGQHLAMFSLYLTCQLLIFVSIQMISICISVHIIVCGNITICICIIFRIITNVIFPSLRRGGHPLVVDAKWLQRKKRILQMRSEYIQSQIIIIR